MTRTNPTVVGAFVVGAIGLVIFGFTIFGTFEFFAKKASIIMIFEGSAKGLSVGAPIDFRGVPLGEVTEIRGLVENVVDIRIAVIGEMNPQGVVEELGLPPPKVPGEYLKKLIASGLRAQLETQSILTGQKYIALDFHPETWPKLYHKSRDHFEIPTIPSQFDILKSNLSALVSKIENLPLEDLIETTTKTVDQFGKTALTADTLIADVQADAGTLTQDAHKVLGDVGRAAQRIDTILADVESSSLVDNTNATVVEAGALAKNANAKIDVLVDQVKIGVASFTQASTALQDALTEAKSAMAAAEGVIEPGSDVHRAVIVALNDLAAAARDISDTAVSIRILTDYLGQNPESVIFGKPAGGQ